MADPVREYLEARRRFEEATQRVQKQISTVERMAASLREWKRLVISNLGGIGFPPELVMGAGVSIDAKEWPRIEELGQALSGWHDARSTLRSAWDRVPEGDRYGLQPPTER
jgi:hypothetical protein